VHESLPYVQLVGRLQYMEVLGEGRKKRLTAYLRDDTGTLEMVWFQGITWLQKLLQIGQDYVVLGKPAYFGGRYSLSHPECQLLSEAKQDARSALHPVYNSTEKLKKKGLDSRGIAKLQLALLEQAYSRISESLPDYLLQAYRFLPKRDAVRQAHYPQSQAQLDQALARLKFEELLYLQLRQQRIRTRREAAFPGQVFDKVPTLNRFYKELLPFDLTDAQKRVIREIYTDMRSGRQMNRLLQGDVGSGKTIVAFICMLMALDNGAQACLMAPTEILADQHYQGLKEFADLLGIQIGKLTGSTPKKERNRLDEALQNGSMGILVGTHALLEDRVDFQNLGLCVIDEQHRFGVAQRAKLWQKQSAAYPHVLVMTATPIPRTLAMTVYGDLHVSVIDELPKGRKPIETLHKYDSNRLWIWGFIRKQIELGRQAYIVYPLVEESEKLDYKNLEDGYESVMRAFPDYAVSIVHGRMKPKDKDYEMQRFVKNETQIMVATTVIEVGVNVPNASVMVIENAERFGLAQLHQLRGRVGRGAEQSYCLLVTTQKLSKDGRTRIDTMVRTNNGFEIADVDLQLRGPGDLMGTQQSGVLDLKFADLAKDGAIVQESRACADRILGEDPALERPENAILQQRLALLEQQSTNWSRIS
jgi:ATP-dependent DNA helicase RecG